MRLMSWQRTNIQAAATYLRERIADGTADPRARAVYEGLLEVLDPNRRALRIQHEMLASVKTAPVPVTRDRRATIERRSRTDRRQVNLGPSDGVERRTGGDRRVRRDRRGS